MDEVATFISQRLKRHDVAFETLQSILASREVDLLKVDLAVFRAAADIFRDHDFLSFTNATTCALMKLHKINNIATFDEDFARLGFNVIR